MLKSNQAISNRATPMIPWYATMNGAEVPCNGSIEKYNKTKTGKLIKNVDILNDQESLIDTFVQWVQWEFITEQELISAYSKAKNQNDLGNIVTELSDIASVRVAEYFANIRNGYIKKYNLIEDDDNYIETGDFSISQTITNKHGDLKIGITREEFASLVNFHSDGLKGKAKSIFSRMLYLFTKNSFCSEISDICLSYNELYELDDEDTAKMQKAINDYHNDNNNIPDAEDIPIGISDRYETEPECIPFILEEVYPSALATLEYSKKFNSDEDTFEILLSELEALYKNRKKLSKSESLFKDVLTIACKELSDDYCRLSNEGDMTLGEMRVICVDADDHPVMEAFDFIYQGGWGQECEPSFSPINFSDKSDIKSIKNTICTELLMNKLAKVFL